MAALVPQVPAGTTAGKTAGSAGIFGGLGPTGYVNQLYAPIAAQLQQQQTARVSTLNSLIQSILANLKAPQPDAYGAAAQDQTAAANAAAATLQRVNPNGATQSMLQAIGAPASQQANVTNQNSQTFNGGAALDQYVGGAIPAGVFAQDQAARNTYLSSLPAIVGMAGVQGLGRLGLLASQENSNLSTQRATAEQNALATLADYVTKNQSNKVSQAAVIGNLLGYIPAGTLGNAKPIGTLAGAKVQQGQARVGIAQQNANTSATRAANAQLNSDRTYKINLAKIGIASRKAQISVTAQEMKLRNGGFTPAQVAKYNGIATTLADNAFNGFTDTKNVAHPKLTYAQAIHESQKEGIPLSIAVKALNSAYPASQRPYVPPAAWRNKPVTPGMKKAAQGIQTSFNDIFGG